MTNPGPNGACHITKKHTDLAREALSLCASGFHPSVCPTMPYVPINNLKGFNHIFVDFAEITGIAATVKYTYDGAAYAVKQWAPTGLPNQQTGELAGLVAAVVQACADQYPTIIHCDNAGSIFSCTGSHACGATSNRAYWLRRMYRTLQQCHDNIRTYCPIWIVHIDGVSNVSDIYSMSDITYTAETEVLPLQRVCVTLLRDELAQHLNHGICICAAVE